MSLKYRMLTCVQKGSPGIFDSTVLKIWPVSNPGPVGPAPVMAFSVGIWDATGKPCLQRSNGPHLTQSQIMKNTHVKYLQTL
jgi:hypothetical protein